jgi:hypothetical protein
MEPKYPLEVIRRYREMIKTEAFERKIQERTPVDLTVDELTLECGHKQQFTAAFLDLNKSNKLQCNDCIREWLKQRVREWLEQQGKE